MPTKIPQPDAKAMAEALVRNSLSWHRVPGLVTVGYFICNQCGLESENMARDTTLAGRFRSKHYPDCIVGQTQAWLKSLEEQD
jgi:hypothetical protein